MSGTFHTLEWVRIIADTVFLVLGVVPIGDRGALRQRSFASALAGPTAPLHRGRPMPRRHGTTMTTNPSTPTKALQTDGRTHRRVARQLLPHVCERVALQWRGRDLEAR